MDTYLFSEMRLQDALDGKMAKALEAVRILPGRAMLERSVDEQSEELIEQFQINAVSIRARDTHAEAEEIDIDLRTYPDRHILDRSRPFWVKGTRVSFVTPFDGDEGLLKLQPNSYLSNPPQGFIRDHAIVLRFEGQDLKPETIAAERDRLMAMIHQHVDWQKTQVDEFNDKLRANLRSSLTARLVKLRSDDALAASLGVPIKRREGEPTTYVVPTVRQKPQITHPSLGEHSTLEPVLAAEEYERMLDIIRGMASVIERNPTAFAGMKEEDLRTHFLLPLNGQYEGQATGETFNFGGKTDILIRVNDRNVFIAECKFWRGPAGLTSTVDQLLGYLSWRDTKAAILLFNRDRNLSRVLPKIPETIRQHSNFVREVAYGAETEFRFVLSHLHDAGREMTVTVLVFEVPDRP